MIRPSAAKLFKALDDAATGATLQDQIEAAALLIYQAVTTASRASGIDRNRVLSETMSGVGMFIAACEIVERSHEGPQHEAAADVAGTLIRKYTKS